MQTVYIITPSWLMKKKKDFFDGLKTIENLGLKVINRRWVTQPLSTSRKVNQIHAAFLNPNVEIILAQRGGYGSVKILPCLNFNLIKKNPKLFAGFSDLSTILNAIYERTGLVTLHSPMLIHFIKPTRLTVRSFLNAVHGFPDKNLFAGAPVKVQKPGIARGVLKGGNLITLTALIGTAWEMDTKHSILFLEEVGEKTHAVDRCLTQWIMAGKLNNIKGLVLGNFQGIQHGDIFKILKERLKMNFPVVSCPYIGHAQNKITLPVGATVELNTFQKSLILL